MAGLSNIKSISSRFKNLLVATAFVATQLVVPVMVSGVVAAAPECVVDTAGVNDQPGQKDLTKLCVDYAGVPTSVQTTWNWDELGTSGSNTMDACSLFDTDGDGNVNYSVCVTTKNTPATLQTLTTYSCGDAKVDRCTSPATPVSSGSTSCSVSQQNTDPFPGGTSSPVDTEGVCTIDLATVGGATARLVDVCSYPSAQPNSDPSDCVIIQPKSGKLEVIKNLEPANDTGLFNLQVNGVTEAGDVGDGGTTGEVVVDITDNNTTNSIGETAGTNTLLSSYTSSVECRDLNGTGAVVASGTGTSLEVPVADGEDIVCIITNTASASITIVKNAVPDSATQDFSFTSDVAGYESFTLDDETSFSGGQVGTDSTPEAVTISVTAGTYNFAEAATSGWYLDEISCPNISENQDLAAGTVSLTVGAGDDITCTFTNRKYGKLLVTKQTNPDQDPTAFSITANPSNPDSMVVGNPTQAIVDGQTVEYQVKQGTYSVSEDPVVGWVKDDSECATLVVTSSDLEASCTIYNTKNALLTIIKDAVPNDPQDFSFTTTGDGLSNFSLDDDDDGTLSNEREFSLIPGSYSVTEGTLDGWKLTDLTCDTNNFVVDDNEVTVNLSAGQETTCTFENTKLGSISGTKFEVNAGATDGTNGTPLENWTIFIDSNGNGSLDPGEATATTDQNGNFVFNDLLPDDYNIVEVLTNGWTQIFSPAPVTLDAGENSEDNDFGNFENGSIVGYKFNDLNGNGAHDILTEPKLGGWTINLYDDQDVLLDSELTDVNDGYTFDNLAPGTYEVCEEAQAGWTQTTTPECFTLVINQSGETETAVFGNQGRGTITVTKEVVNNNGGDAVISDFTLRVDGAEVTSGVGGEYAAFEEYTVSEDDPTGQGYEQTNLVCYNDAQDSLGDTFTLDPGENVVCTITNDDIAPELTVYKFVDNNGTILTKTASDFTMNVSGTNVSDTSFPGSTLGVTVTLDAGAYTVTEDVDSDYTVSYSSDCVDTISVGETKTCYVENTAIRKPAINVVKDGPATAKNGQTITYTFTVTNPGNVPLSGVTVSDDVAGDGAVLQSGDLDSDMLLDPGETWIYTVDYTVPEDTESGSIVNTVTTCAGEVIDVELLLDLNSRQDSGVCDTDTHTTRIFKPQVLGDSTVLPDTGQNPIVNVIAGAMLILLAVVSRWVGRKSQSVTL